MGRLRILALAVLMVMTYIDAYPYAIKRYGGESGLSNSAILSLAKDSRGFLWIGTCDGIDIFTGNEIISLSSLTGTSSLTGELVKNLYLSGKYMWAMTPYGINAIHPDDMGISSFDQFREGDVAAINNGGTAFVVTRGGNFYYSLPGDNRTFINLQGVRLESVPKAMWADDHKLIIVASDGIYALEFSMANNAVSVADMKCVSKRKVTEAWVHGGEIFLLLEDGGISRYSPSEGGERFLVNVSRYKSERGDVRDVAIDMQGNILVGFVSGVLRFDSVGENPEDLGINCGVFCLLADDNQDIVWIGTDGEGLYACANGQYSMRSIKTVDFNARLSYPIRAIHIDSDNNLWLGSKGDGLIKIKDFEMWNRAKRYEPERYTTNNSALLDNSVYAITEAKDGGIWVGTEDGINYKPKGTDKLQRVHVDGDIRYVHGIIALDDTTLWIASVGQGVIEARIYKNNGSPSLKVKRTYAIEGGNLVSNFFFSIFADRDGNIWAGNRGFGLFSIRDNKMRYVPFVGKYDTRTVNDVYSVYCGDDRLWIGTGHALILKEGNTEHTWVRDKSFPDTSIHALTEDENGDLWVSTNTGIVRVSGKTGNTQVFDRHNGLGVTEYSDGAVFKKDNSILFGGIDGLAIIGVGDDSSGIKKYNPHVEPVRFNVAGKYVALDSVGKWVDDRLIVRLRPDDNTFSISFVVPDFIDNANYTYLYRLNDDDEWLESTTPGLISVAAMPHGNYELQVKAINGLTGEESKVTTVYIDIAAPWYATIWAKLIYFLIIALAVIAVVIYKVKSMQRKQERLRLQLENEHKEQTYEEKLRFFTNVTHEFCTPLTLIYGPCERLLSYSGSDNYIRHYASLIKNNTERLNSLIQEIIDFRRAETGHQKLSVKKTDVTGLCNDVASSFSDLKERQEVTFETEIENGIIWATDYRCFTKIVYNLVSNAFKYTHAGGTIRLTVMRGGDNLLLKVYNTGKGIKENDKSSIFNRYLVLDNVEENATKGLSSRNGLGLAICMTMTKLLGGEIDINSEEGKYAEFIVKLPQLECGDCDDGREIENDSDMLSFSRVSNTSSSIPDENIGMDPAAVESIKEESKFQILVVDDNRDMLSLLRDSISEYNVVTAASAEEGLDITRKGGVGLIITDVMMPGVDGFEFTKMVKNDPHTSHIPIIILSARNATDDMIDGLESGADNYIPKPFTQSYLRAVIKRLLKGKSEMAEYYNTAASAFKYHNGQLINSESKDFIESIDEYIDANIDSEELNTESLALHMQTSTRNLYRKMKELGLLPPNDYIKEHRMALATKLLVTTNLTIQEIIYRCGFNNRSHFYKEFDKRHSMTPKDYRMQHKK